MAASWSSSCSTSGRGCDTTRRCTLCRAARRRAGRGRRGGLRRLAAPAQRGRVGPGTALERGRALYEASCQRCHGAQGEGSADAFHPRIGGQHYRYMVRQLIDIASGRRANAHPDMVLVVSEFSARDVSAVADWVSRRSAPDSSPAR
ncbi:MAG: c-type cytochrome [Myxococcota bacterium]